MIDCDRVMAGVRPRSGLMSVAAALALAGCALEAPSGADLAEDGEEVAVEDEELEGEELGPDGVVPLAATTGTVDVVLHPGPSATIGTTTTVTFGMPFPPGVLASTSQLSAFTTSGDAVRIHARSILPWRVWPGRSGYTESVRAAQVTLMVKFSTRAPKTIRMKYGQAPTRPIAAPSDPLASWVAVSDGSYPTSVREPRVYATLPPSWLSASLLRTTPNAVGADASFSWFDASMVGSAHTAVNDVPASVTERIDYLTDYEAWLFDRSATLFGVYFRTGDLQWLREAHRSSQFYARHIDSAGYFDLKPGDLKYSYGRSLLMDYQLTGDPALLDAIERVAEAGTSWDPAYEVDDNFWTERHQTYALLAALSAWEATGADEHAERARQVAEESFAMAADPAGSWHDDGCMLHGMTAHEGAGGDVPVCSPWMSALFSDAVWEYYIHSQDEAALAFMSDLATFVSRYGVYSGEDELSFLLPWYLASSATTFSDDGPWGDVEHTCDVAGLVARGAWAEKQRGGDPAPLRDTAERLLEGCAWNLDSWHRPDAPEVGKTEWRLSPPRKFNWWFGTTSDLPWLMEETV
jgi:hypothetical protein